MPEVSENLGLSVHQPQHGPQRLCYCRTFLLEVLYFFFATLSSLKAKWQKPVGPVGWFGAALIAHLHVTLGVISRYTSLEGVTVMSVRVFAVSKSETKYVVVLASGIV